MRVCVLVASVQAESGSTCAWNGGSGPEANRHRTGTTSVVAPGLKMSIDDDPMGISPLWGIDHWRSGRGDPGTMASPELLPENTWVSLATTRPVRAATVVATADWSCT